MKKLHFSIQIQAQIEKVWKTMIEPETYKIWTQEFSVGSYYEGSWEKGAKIRFLSPQGEGMLSEIAEFDHHRFLSIRHLGFIKDGKEDTTSDAIKAWASARENYTFTQTPVGVEVSVDTDTPPEFEQMMAEMWPKALLVLKTICESSVPSVYTEVRISAPIEKVWKAWTEPAQIKQWNFALDTWGVGTVENDLRVGGRFKTNMHAKDGSAAFDFEGTYTIVDPLKYIQYTTDDDRFVDVRFATLGSDTFVSQVFQAEKINPVDMQRSGWQAILENFKKFVEGQ